MPPKRYSGGEAVACNSAGEMQLLNVDADRDLQVDVKSSALPTDGATHTGQDEIKAVIGEVQATPTSNTVLDRLKSAVTHLATLAGAVSANKVQVGIDQVTANANEVVVKSITAGPLPDTSAGDFADIRAKIDTMQADIAAIENVISSLKVDASGRLVMVISDVEEVV